MSLPYCFGNYETGPVRTHGNTCGSDHIAWSSPGGGGSASCSSCSCGTGGACDYGQTGPLPGSEGVYTGTSTTCTCVDPGTWVETPTGECLLAGELQIGDRIVSAGGSDETVVFVERTAAPKLRIVSSAGQLECSEDHPLLTTTGDFLRAIELEPGVHRLQGSSSEIVSVEAVLPGGWGDVIRMTCEPSHTFRAGGLIHHNKPIHVIAATAASL